MGSSKASGLHFRRIRLENWRNFMRVDAHLTRRVFLVGANATGKSNLLDAFRFLHDICIPGGGFETAVQQPPRSGVSQLRCLAARQYPDIALATELLAGETSETWEYELRFGQDNQRRPVIRKERVVRNGRTLFERPDQSDEDDPQRLRQSFLQQVNVNRGFRELVDFFAGIRYLHLVPQLVRDPERSVGRPNDPYGGDFLEQVARTASRTQKARLSRIRDALRVAVPQLQELELVRDQAKGTPHLRGRYEHWRPHGAWQNESQFSDGTLRLLGLLWAIQDGAGPLLLEEPETSLHPDVVRFIPQMIARMQRRTGRQVIISTHSPDLLHDEGVGLDEVLLLVPKAEGTDVHSAGSFEEVPLLLAGGSTLADAVMARTRVPRAQQLTLFGD